MEEIFDFNETNGLVFSKDPGKAQNDYELLHIYEAQSLKVDAIFFRRYYKEESTEGSKSLPYYSEPAVYILYRESEFVNSEENIKLHSQIWSAGKSEIYAVLNNTSISIINARKPAQVVSAPDNLSIADLILVNEAVKTFNAQRFSSYLFTTGTFWEQGDFYDQTKDQKFYANKLAEENMPYHQLLSFLKTTRKQLKRNKTLTVESEIIDKLLIICILMKFLEAIKSEDGQHTLSQIYNKHNVDDFASAIIKGKSIDILQALGKQHNGKIFDYFTDKLEGESDEEHKKRNDRIKEKLKNTNLSPIAQLLNVRIDRSGELEFDGINGQGNLELDFSWQQYSFRFLPIELISSIYEHFLQTDSVEQKGEEEKGVVYTPPFLVNFLIDESMPLDQSYLLTNNSFKIVDPSCGSGIFLVSAYKRLQQWWIINYYKENNQLPSKLSPSVFQQLLENNIFGVDINKKATLITIFSLTIAFLDKLDPIAFWEHINFKNLQKNIQTKNFFQWASTAPKNFNLAIGNPPFNVENKKDKIEVLVPEYLLKIGFKHSQIPNNNFALHFFEGSLALAQKACLIIPANILLYNNNDTTKRYRNSIFKDFTVGKIVDFTHLRRGLFHRTADTPVVAISVENMPSQGKSIEHVVIKRTISTEKKLRFEIDHYDRHVVQWNWAVDNTKQFIWKTNLLGGGRLFHMIYKFSLLPTLKDFILAQDKWEQIRGFEGGTGKVLRDKDRIIEIKSNGKPVIQKGITIETSNLKRESMYTPPFMIIDQIIASNSIPVCFVPSNNDYTDKPKLYYNRDFIGVSVPKKEENLLRQAYATLRNQNKRRLNFKFFLVATSSSSLILTETDVNKSEILNIPFPKDDRYLMLSESERAIQQDVLDYYIHLGKAISKGSAGAILHETVQPDQIDSFQTMFCAILNERYEQDGLSWQPGVTCQTSLYCITQFGFGKKGKISHKHFDSFDKLNDTIKSLIKDNLSNRGATFNKVLRICKHVNGYDCVFLIKPNARKYWLNSVSIRDADDTYLHLKSQGF